MKAKEPVPGDEYHPTVTGPDDLTPHEDEAQLIGFSAEMSAAVTKLTKSFILRCAISTQYLSI